MYLEMTKPQYQGKIKSIGTTSSSTFITWKLGPLEITKKFGPGIKDGEIYLCWPHKTWYIRCGGLTYEKHIKNYNEWEQLNGTKKD